MCVIESGRVRVRTRLSLFLVVGLCKCVRAFYANVCYSCNMCSVGDRVWVDGCGERGGGGGGGSGEGRCKF